MLEAPDTDKVAAPVRIAVPESLPEVQIVEESLNRDKESRFEECPNSPRTPDGPMSPNCLSPSTTVIKLDDDDDFPVRQQSGGAQKESSECRSSDDVHQLAFLLTLFDNIVGPRLVHFWKFSKSNRYKFPLDAAMLKYIAIHTLNGELYQEKLFNQFKYRVYLIKEIECAIFSIFFDAFTISSPYGGGGGGYGGGSSSGNDDDSISPASSITESFANKNNAFFGNNNPLANNKQVSTSLNCFSLIVPLEIKDLILNKHGDTTSFLINSFENYMMEFKVLAHIKPKKNHITTALDHLTKCIKEFCSNLFVLKTKGLVSNRMKNINDQLLSSYRIQIRDTYFNECYFTSTFHSTSSSMNNDFLVNAITSHLITNFNTIVIGKTSASINKMIATLALFMPKEKLAVSCYALHESTMLSPFICLQGFVTENPEDLSTILDSNFIFKRESPTTIVDLSYKQILRTPILNEYACLREKFIHNKLKFLYNSLTLENLNSAYPVYDNLKWISSDAYSQKSTLITTMLKQMDLLESEFGIKDSYFDLVQKDFYLMALNLIEYINNEQTTNKKEKQTKFSTKKICKDLDIKTTEDLNVLIAYSNYLKPGFSTNLIFTN